MFIIVADHARRSMSEYPLARAQYYGVNYGERAEAGHSPERNPCAVRSAAAAANMKAKRARLTFLQYAANDLSFYANIPVPTSYMCMGVKRGFFRWLRLCSQAGIIHYRQPSYFSGQKAMDLG